MHLGQRDLEVIWDHIDRFDGINHPADSHPKVASYQRIHMAFNPSKLLTLHTSPWQFYVLHLQTIMTKVYSH